MKSILLHVYDDTAFETRLQAALDVARAFEGHITCLHATPFEDYLEIDPWVSARLPEEFSEKMKQLRQALQARVEDRLRREGVSWDWRHTDDLMADALILHSIVSDVIVLTLSGRAIERRDPRPLAGRVAVGGRAPILAIPEQLDRLELDAPILVAWNGSPEAAGAVRSAMPFLRRAPTVHLLEVEDKISRYPRDLIARYLSRHDVHPEILQRRAVNGSVSAAIRTTALELGAGLIVIGAYGHSRLRELIFGGVTHDLITDTPVPLLLGR